MRPSAFTWQMQVENLRTFAQNSSYSKQGTVEYNCSTHMFIKLQHLNKTSVLPILCVKRSVTYFEISCVIKRKIMLGCQHSLLINYSDALNFKTLFTAIYDTIRF